MWFLSGMGTNVNTHVAGLREEFTTVDALPRLDLFVDAPIMSMKTSAHFEAQWTLITCEWLLVCVYTKVYVQLTTLDKRQWTLRTFVWPLTGMDLQVNVKGMIVFEAASTYVTDEWCNIQMGAFVVAAGAAL